MALPQLVLAVAVEVLIIVELVGQVVEVLADRIMQVLVLAQVVPTLEVVEVEVRGLLDLQLLVDLE
jgi:hypothetical protein